MKLYPFDLFQLSNIEYINIKYNENLKMDILKNLEQKNVTIFCK